MKFNPESLAVSNAKLANKYRRLAFFWMTLAVVGWAGIITFTISFLIAIK